MKNKLRSAIEKLSRGIVLRRKITVNEKSVSLFVTPDSQLKYLKCWGNSFDNDLILIAGRFVNKKSVIWDVGANVGVFAFASACMASEGTVVAIEPDTWLVGLLRRSADLPEYRGRDVRILPVAISSRSGIAKFMIAERGRASNSLEEAGGRSQMGGVREMQYVPTTTLDTLLSYMPCPDFVKVDIEGAELKALQGAEQLIHRIRPVFYIEVGENTSDEVYGIFHAAHYRAFDGVSGESVDCCSPNTFFIPADSDNAGASLFI